MDALLGQTGDGQVEFLRPAKFYGVTAGELRLLQHRTQVVQDFNIALLSRIPGGDADGGKGVVGRGGQVLCLPLLDVRRQFAAATRFQLFHHIRTKLGNQTENVLGGEGVVAGPVHRMADRYIAGKTQQSFVYILRAQFQPHRAGRKDGKPILPLSHKEVPLLPLLFYVLPQCVGNFVPARQPPQGVAEGGGLLIGEALQRQSGQVPLQQLAG